MGRGLRGGENGFDGLAVTGATAEIARQRVADVVLGGMGVVFEQRLGVQDHSGCAEPALRGAVIEEGFLYRIKLIAVGNAFDGQDLAAIGLCCKHEAGIDGLVVEQDGTRSALPGFAAAFDAVVAFAAEDVEQEVAGGDGPVLGLAVYGESDLDVFHSVVLGVAHALACGSRALARPAPAKAGATQVHPACSAHSRRALATSTRLISRRYSAVARTSVIGSTSRATSWDTSSISASSSFLPISSFSAFSARNGVGATAPSAMRAHLQQPRRSI